MNLKVCAAVATSAVTSKKVVIVYPSIAVERLESFLNSPRAKP